MNNNVLEVSTNSGFLLLEFYWSLDVNIFTFIVPLFKFKWK